MPNGIIVLMDRKTWTKIQLKEAVKASYSYRQVLNKLNLKPAGGNYAQLKKYIKEYDFDISHFKGKGWNRGLQFLFTPKIPIDKILVKGNNFQSYKLKNRLIKEGLKKP